MTLVVWDGYRPIATQAALYNGYLDELTMVHADWPADALEDAAARYVTPPSRSALAPPPHLTGGAVDLTLGDGDGRPLDLGTDFDAFVPEAAVRALEDAPGRARDLRRTLYWAMAGQGFTPVPRGVVALRPRRPVLGPRDRSRGDRTERRSRQAITSRHERRAGAPRARRPRSRGWP